MAHASVNIRHTGSERESSKIRAQMSVGSLLSKVLLFQTFFVLFLFGLSPCQVRFTFLNDIWKCYKLWRNLLLLIEHCGMRLSMMWKIMRLRRRRVNSLWDRHHSSRHTRAEFHNCNSHSKIFLIFLTTSPRVDFLQTLDSFVQRFQDWKGCRYPLRSG